MLQYKNTINFSELKEYFISEEKTFNTLSREISSLKLSDKLFQGIDKVNTQHSSKQKFTLLMLFPLFCIKHISDFYGSILYQSYKCGKDVFYEFLNNPLFDWRGFLYKITIRQLKRVEKASYPSEEKAIKCLIADDTDLPKRGRRFELQSRIYSHVTHTFNYGFKGLFLAYHDGKSFFGLDFSLHGEKGSNPEKPYGLTAKQSKKRFSKERGRQSAGKKRETEYFKKKTDMLILMLRTAIVQGVRFDYLLTDSWFTNFELIKFIKSRKIKCYFLGMVKNGTAKYLYNTQELTLKMILQSLKHSKRMSYNKKYRCWFYEVHVELKGIKVKLFYCRTSKRGKWNCLLTTNCDLTFEKAYEIYATRWCIEVFFKECKQLLRLGKCESRGFDAQIAATTLCILQYNLLSLVKRFDGYESLGALFRQAGAETLEITIKERIWLLIIEMATVLSDFFDFERDDLLKHLLSDNVKLKNIIRLKYLTGVA